MIDKNKAYRFRGDSERWVWNDFSSAFANGTLLCNPFLAEHLHQKGILLEYPELPGEDWEYCDEKCGEAVWDEAREWVNRSYVTNCEDGIYCRKKKPVITEVECVVAHTWFGSAAANALVVTSHNDLLKGIRFGDRVKVTKL